MAVALHLRDYGAMLLKSLLGRQLTPQYATEVGEWVAHSSPRLPLRVGTKRCYALRRGDRNNCLTGSERGACSCSCFLIRSFSAREGEQIRLYRGDIKMPPFEAP